MKKKIKNNQSDCTIFCYRFLLRTLMSVKMDKINIFIIFKYFEYFFTVRV